MSRTGRLSNELFQCLGFVRNDFEFADRVPKDVEPRDPRTDWDRPYDEEARSDHEARIELFWALRKPTITSLDPVRWTNPKTVSVVLEDPDLTMDDYLKYAAKKAGAIVIPDDLQVKMLKRLIEIERGHRWIFELGGQSDEMFTEWTLQEYLHVCAATAFALKAKDGYSEDVRDLYKRAWWAGRQHSCYIVRYDGYRHFDIEDGTGSRYWYWISGWAVTGLVLLELARIRRMDGEYEDALHMFAEALDYLANAKYIASIPFEGWVIEHVAYGFDGDYAKAAKWDDRWRKAINLGLSSLDSNGEEPARIVEQLFNSHSRVFNWPQVASDCRTIADSWDEVFGPTELTDATGKEVDWLQFWYCRQGRAEEHLSPSEFRKYQDESEDQAAEFRLRSYFFPEDLWMALPKKARQTLTSAERTWYFTRTGSIESAIKDLNMAVESTCYELIWTPLRQLNNDNRFRGDPGYKEFLKRALKYEGTTSYPTLTDYVGKEKVTGILEFPCFKIFVDCLGLDERERRFLTNDLAKALRKLRDARNQAEHNPTKIWNRLDVTPLMNEFLGVGCPGILPKLASIKKKKRSSLRANE